MSYNSSFPEFEYKEKFTTNKLENELYNKDDNVIAKVIRVKYLDNYWQIFSDKDLVYTVYKDGFNDKQIAFLKTYDGFQLLIKLRKENKISELAQLIK
jgi:hypothetical protein